MSKLCALAQSGSDFSLCPLVNYILALENHFNLYKVLVVLGRPEAYLP